MRNVVLIDRQKPGVKGVRRARYPDIRVHAISPYNRRLNAHRYGRWSRLGDYAA